MKKYEIVENWVKTGMQSGRFLPGDQLPSEAQISSELTIARNSVRQALGNLAAHGFVETRQGIGTFCLAPAHAATGSRDIALICFSTSQYIFPDLVNGVQATLNRTGYHMILSQTACDAKIEREMLLGLRDRGIAGIVLEPSFGGDGFSNADVVRDLVDAGVPVVLVDNATGDDDFSSFTMDDFAGGRLAASHLYERGHRDIGVVFDSDYLPKIRRRNGMVELLAERGVEVPDAWQVSYRSPHNNFAVQSQIRSCLTASGNRPTAFCCSSDDEAMDVLAAATEVGLSVPDDISIIGFDNAAISSLGHLGLTTIDHPTRYIAELATSLLVHSIRHPEIVSRTVTSVRPRLVSRSSVRDLRDCARSTTGRLSPAAMQK